METIKKIFSWLVTITPLLRALLIFFSALVVFLLSLASCGTTRAVVHTRDTSAATITITTNNPIDVSTTPNVQIEIPKN